jgi:hypothetical protein
MGSNIGFFCEQSDNDSLQKYVESIGLSIVPPLLNRHVSDDPSEGPFCFLSAIDVSLLSPYGTPPLKISDATDPLLLFMRAYYKDVYLVLGHIAWSDDVPNLAKQTKPYYQKIAKWIKSEWQKYGDFYIGPGARKLFDDGAQMVNFLPGTIREEIIKLDNKD